VFFFQLDPDQAPILHSGREIAPSEIVCYPLESEHHYRTPTSSLYGTISLSQECFAAYEKVLVERGLPAPSAMRVVRPRPAQMSWLLTLNKAVTDLAATSPDTLLHPEVNIAIEQALIHALIACLADPGAEETHRPSRARLSVMSRFERVLAENANRPLYLAEICTTIGVGERTLREHCLDQLRMPPHRYLWLRRLYLARRALALGDARSTTVTMIANDYGFGEIGRFGVAYRRQFGEAPSATLRRAPDLPEAVRR